MAGNFYKFLGDAGFDNKSSKHLLNANGQDLVRNTKMIKAPFLASRSIRSKGRWDLAGNPYIHLAEYGQ